jgi:hypothetical protein
MLNFVGIHRADVKHDKLALFSKLGSLGHTAQTGLILAKSTLFLSNIMYMARLRGYASRQADAGEAAASGKCTVPNDRHTARQADAGAGIRPAAKRVAVAHGTVTTDAFQAGKLPNTRHKLDSRLVLVGVTGFPFTCSVVSIHDLVERFICTSSQM